MNYDWLKSNTLAMWLFDGSVYDESENNYHLNQWYSPANYSIGKFCQCANFTGSGAQACAREIASTDPIMRKSFSVCVWLNTANDYELQNVLSMAEYFEYSGTWGWLFMIDAGHIGFFSANNSGTDEWDSVYSNQVISDSEWHWIVITVSGTTKKIYIDGLLDISGSSSSIGYPEPYPLALSAGKMILYNYGTEYYEFIGMMHRLELLDTVLSGRDIFRMYAFQMGWL